MNVKRIGPKMMKVASAVTASVFLLAASIHAQTVAAPISTPSGTASLSPEALKELQAKTDAYYSAKHQAIGFGISGTLLGLSGVVVWVMAQKQDCNVPCGQSCKTHVDAGQAFAAGVLYAVGTTLEILGTVRTVQAIVRGVQLHLAEDSLGYRLSVVPTFRPSSGTAGIVARAEF